MSIFSDAMAVGMSVSYETVFGEDARYTDSSGWNCDCKVILDTDLSLYGDTLTVQAATAVIRVRRSEVPDRPKRLDTFDVGGTTYTVEGVNSSDDYEHVVGVS